MSAIKKSIIKDIFKNITESLIQRDDGTYIFKNGKYQCQSRIILGSGFKEEDIPTKEEICEYFEKTILSKIPKAVIFIHGDTAISVDISGNINLLKKIYRAKKELDIYESIKTLFLPTMKESIVKFGKSNPEWIYIPYRKFKAEIYNIDEDGNKKDIRFVSPYSRIMRSVDNAAIDFLIEDINYYISTLKFRNPIPKQAIKLPQQDLTIEELKSQPRKKKKGFYMSEFYSYNQKIKFLKKLFEDFLEYYPYIINNNFPRIKNAFSLFSNFPIKISIYTKKIVETFSNVEDIKFTYTYEKLSKDSDNQVELIENQEIVYDPDKHLICRSTLFSGLLTISYFGGFHIRRSFETDRFKDPYIAEKNALPYTYRFIKEELDEILEKVQSDTIFDEIKPYVPHVESWIQIILDAEKRGDESYYIELKRIPTESPNRDGTGNDIYSEINAFENTDGGDLFIGVDENKKGLEKIVGLEGYFRDHNKNLDIVKREITDKCIKYLGKTYRIDSDTFEGKTLIRIRISSNYGYVSWFTPEKGIPRAYIRENGKKRIMKPWEIEKRLTGRG